MNVLFLTLVDINTIYFSGIYTDLIRTFDEENHKMYVISPVEKRSGKTTHIIKESNTTILKLRIGNIQKTNMIEKGISTVLIEPIYKKAIKQYFSNVRFDLILYSTPPITLVGAIEYVKKRDGARTYLLLKDIFPQNAVDIGVMSTTGIKGILYNHFRKQEKKLYSISDCIGCMSQANVDYVIQHNLEVDSDKVEICPNSISVVDKNIDDKTKIMVRKKYGIPIDKMVFIYGGNLGKPQGIPFLIECLRRCRNIENAYFLVVGDGTEYSMLENYLNNSNQNNLRLMKRLPKDDYDNMVGSCDIGMIFLDHRFTIPNFPSRLLSYMSAKLPILACTDPNTDLGKVVTEAGFGWWCESDDVDAFCNLIRYLISADQEKLKKMGNKAFCYLEKKYSVGDAYNCITQIDKL